MADKKKKNESSGRDKRKDDDNGELLKKRRPDHSVEDLAREEGSAPATQKKLKDNNGVAVPNGDPNPAGGGGVTKWWERDDENEEIKWNYLEHKGVVFPPFYDYRQFIVKYNGNIINLNRQQEEMAYYWSQSVGTDWEHKAHYRKNFAREFTKTFEKALGYTNLDLFDFSDIVNYITEQKEKKKNRSAEEKKEEKEKKKIRDDYYGFAIVDNDKEKVGGFSIEPPTLFKGRGEHPKAGFMKARILPEDLTLNIAETAPIPKCDMPGHSWGDIVHNNEVTWLAFYKDDTINTTYKYIFLAASSKFKGLNDRKKYDKARRLKDCIDDIRGDYKRKLVSKDKFEKQLGTATYLIDVLALRVGNEKSEDEADTVGCCSLRVEHVSALPDNQIMLDFLGKDSMRYNNTVTVDEQVWKNIKSFLEGKDPDNDLFDKINTSDLNNYLRSQMEGLTAKVFRTFNASMTLERVLSSKDVSHLEIDEKMAWYNEANRQVAILCNHQKTVSKTFDASFEKQKLKLDDLKDYLEQLKTHYKKVNSGKDGLNQEKVEKDVMKKLKEAGNEDKVKICPRKFPENPEKAKDLLQKHEKRVKAEENKLADREENKAIALGTSKLNYNDPRITVRWCKQNEVPIEKVFSKTVRSKFPWAMYTELDWKF